MPHVSFDFIHQYLLKGVWPPTVCTKGEKANFRKACRPFAVKDEELFYKKVKNDETGEKVEVSDSVGSGSLSDDKRVIYLQHTNSNHFDYIKGIM